MTARSPDASPITVRPRAVAEYPLTRTQELIWTSQRLAPTTPLANMGKLHRFFGPVDAERFVEAFDTIVRASDALRTVVLERPGARPVARVCAAPPCPTEIVDIPVAQLDDWCAARIASALDATVCAYDSVLLRHSDDDWSWYLDLHHVVTDAFASALIFDRVGALYSGEATSPDLVPYYEHTSQRPDRDDERIRFWDSMCHDGPPIAPYGPRGRRTSAASRRPVDPKSDLDAALTGPYRTISRELGLLGIVAAATAVLLHRLDGRPEIVLGIPIHHRSNREAKRVIGALMELYPLRVSIDPNESGRALFDRVHRDIVTVLRTARAGESPETPFDAVVNVLTARFGKLGDTPTETRWVRAGHVDPAHALRVQVYDYGDGLRIELDVNDALSADGAHDRITDHFRAQLDTMVEAPDRPAVDADLLTDDERALLRSLNPPGPSDRLRPVHDVIAERLAADPEHVTAECEGDLVTAARLDEVAQRCANGLRSRGVGRGDRVGIRMHRSIELLTAVHGVLRAGAAFVLLDPDDPPERHRVIADDAGLALILDGPDEVTEFREVTRQHEVTERMLDDLDDLAYILYTSGSTGAPKGVPISHRGLADYLRFAEAAYSTTDEFVMALHSSVVFDLTITSLFLPQLVGGRTVIVPGAPLEALASIANRPDLTVLKATPSQLELLNRMIDTPLPLQVVIVGGEAFRTPVAAAFASRCNPGVRIFNEYGPTEAVVGCMIHEWDPESDSGPDVPIGLACPGAEVFVLDAHGNPATVGSWGELYVRRPGMAVGYLNLPESTAERFTPVPAIDDRAVYRTGDRVRIERGVLVYGGRGDDQLKVNGVRLEPGEIEAALVQHPAITNAVVRLWTPGQRRVDRCASCGLGTDVPGIDLDGDGICSVCRTFDRVEPQTRDWFRTPDDLDAIRVDARTRSSGEFDCLHLLSGGKDSTYALYQLVGAGWRVHALTLDNGYISDGAKQNISRTISDLGVSHEFVTTDAMNEIFRDSLDRYANVCNGCYKTIYTLATARAHELGIPVIVTGLSRGQFFETRLVPHQFESGRFDPDAIDRTVLQARRAYHRTTDAVTRLLPQQQVFERGDLAVLDEIRYVDFYRYVHVELAEMYEFLERRAPWVRPADTGRSTNCLINVVGIHVHRTERGYHNYAEPYSWDVRLGHKTRDEALEELDDPVDQNEIDRILAEIDYRPKRTEVLTAWYQTADARALDPADVRAHLRDLLPARSIPAAFVHVDDIPLASSTKLDVTALPPPTRTDGGSQQYLAPITPTEAIAADVWAAVLGVDRVGRNDDFFDLGGSSLPALETIAAMETAIGGDLPDALVFQHRVLQEFAAAVELLVGTVAPVAEIPALPENRRPLSPGEAAMLFEYRSDPRDTRYNVTRLYTVDDDLDIGRLRTALDVVVLRHQPLHTSFDAARTVLSASEACSLEPMAEGSIDEFADRQRSAPFDLDNGPLMRVHHSSSPTGGTALLIALHHICVDAGTFDLLWAELDAAYHGRPLADLATTVGAHGEWQRTRWGDAIDHWTAEPIGGETHAVAGFAPPNQPGPDGYLEIDAPVSTSELAAAATTTPFAASLAAAASVLATHSRAAQVEIGITASTKDHPAAEPLIGYFLNTLPLSFSVGPDATFADLDISASAAVTEALPHRTLPLSEIVARRRQAGRPTPDVSHMLAYERLAPTTWGAGEARHRILASGTSVSDLTFFVQERGETLRLGLEYRGTAIDRTHAAVLLERFAAAIRAMSESRNRPIRSVIAAHASSDLVGPELPGEPTSIVEQFDRIARSEPELVAVVEIDGTESTYGHLRQRAIGLTDAIQRVAPTPRRVGVCVGRSALIVDAMLATQYAGAAYVPLDPTSPDDRLRLIVDVADLDAVIVDEANSARFGGLPTVLATTAPASEGVGYALPDLETPAYVIFTSGSTGRPAGVEVTHRNLATSTSARGVFYRHSPTRFLLTSSIGFDSSLVGLTWPLSTGGAVVVPNDDIVHDVDQLGAAIDESAVTHILMVPSLYRAMIDRCAARLARVRVAIVAGEACPAALVIDHHSRLPGVELVNEYGPTEATVWATAHRCAPGDDPVPIGLPIAGTTVRIGDTFGDPLPTGVPGELAISGPGVTSGYLGSERARSFVEHDGRWWYRTGDLVVSDTAGRLVFLGRVDDQLNVGGLRLEPAEIERHLIEIDGVVEAVVVTGRVADREVLVAHLGIGPDADSGPDLDIVRRHLAGRVQPAAVPRAVVVHATLPRTAHGKIDRRRAASLPVDRSFIDGTTLDRPAGAVTDTIGLDRFVDVWRRVLGRPDAGDDADFFALGGDSLAAVELVTALGELIGRTVPIAALLTASTPAAMHAALVAAQTRSASPIALVTLRPGTRTGPVVLFTAAWDDVQGYRELADAFDPSATVVAAVVAANDDRLDQVDHVAAAIVASIGSSIREPDVVLGWSIGGVVAFEVGQLLGFNGTAPRAIALIDTYFPGEQRHIWSNRWWKYKSMLRPGSIGAVTAELRTMIGRRIRAVIARIGRRLLVWAGETGETTNVPKTTPGGIPFAAMNHRPTSGGVPVVLYAATTTNPKRTIEPWSRIAPDLRVVRLEGRHRGYDSIMGRDRVGVIVDDLRRTVLGPAEPDGNP